MAAINFTIGLFEIYQTTTTYRNPGAGFAGRPMNLGLGIDTAKNASGCGHCLFVWFCVPCAIGSIGQEAFGLPFIMGCCCMNPCNMRNFLRYQYRLKLLSSDCDCIEECVLPWFSYCFVSAAFSIIPGSCLTNYGSCLTNYLGLLAIVAEDLAVVRHFSQNHSKQYLVGYNPPNAEQPGMAQPIGQPAIFCQPVMAQPIGQAEMVTMQVPWQPMVVQIDTPSQLPAYAQAVPAYQRIYTPISMHE